MKDGDSHSRSATHLSELVSISVKRWLRKTAPALGNSDQLCYLLISSSCSPVPSNSRLSQTGPATNHRMSVDVSSSGCLIFSDASHSCLFYKCAFLNCGPVDTLCWIIHSVGACLVHLRMFSSIPGLFYPVDDRSTPLVMTKTSPDIAKCPLRGKVASSQMLLL